METVVAPTLEVISVFDRSAHADAAAVESTIGQGGTLELSGRVAVDGNLMYLVPSTEATRRSTLGVCKA